MKLGENITKIRKNKNLTQEQFAEELNVSAKTVSSWEKGRNLPSIEVLLDISQKYDISLDELVENNKETKENYKESGINKEIKTVLIIVAIMLVPVIFGIWNMYFYNDIINIQEYGGVIMKKILVVLISLCMIFY